MVTTKVRINGGDFLCHVAGEGPGLVFIHGEIHGPEYFEHQLSAFARTHRCVAYARRGHAGTGEVPGGWSLDSQTDDLEGIVRHFGLERPALVAVAFGATIAANYAIRHPSGVRAMAIVAWSELHEATQYLERWEKASRTVVEILERDGRDALVDYLMREGGRSIYYVIPTDSPVREACVRMFAGHPIELYRTGMLAFARSVPDLVPRFERLALPVLGLCGALDPFPDQPQVLARMPGFREHPPIAGACRFVQWEKPAEFNRILATFLESVA